MAEENHSNIPLATITGSAPWVMMTVRERLAFSFGQAAIFLAISLRSVVCGKIPIFKIYLLMLSSSFLFLLLTTLLQFCYFQIYKCTTYTNTKQTEKEMKKRKERKKITSLNFRAEYKRNHYKGKKKKKRKEKVRQQYTDQDKCKCILMLLLTSNLLTLANSSASWNIQKYSERKPSETKHKLQYITNCVKCPLKKHIVWACQHSHLPMFFF